MGNVYMEVIGNRVAITIQVKDFANWPRIIACFKIPSLSICLLGYVVVK